MRICLIIFSILINVQLTTAQADNNAQQKPNYIFSALPYRPIQKLEADFSPFLADVNKIAPFKVSLKLSLDSLRYFKLISDQVPDFIIVNPFDSVPAQDKFGYLPVYSKPLHRCKIVTINNNINRIEDLKNKKIGFASKRSPISFYSQRVLDKHGLLPNKNYTKINHKSVFKCLHNLVIAKVDACTAPYKAVKSFKKNRNIDIKELAQCEAFPGMVFMVHKRVPKNDFNKINDLFINGQHYSKGKAGHPHKNFSTYNAEQFLNIRKHYYQWLNAQ